MGIARLIGAAALLAVGLQLAAALPAATPSSLPERPAPQVVVGRAHLQGQWTPSGSAIFRAIPYAQPPLQALRWKPPQALTLPAGVRPALQPAPSCLQAYVGWNRADAERGSEDCLYLDIRTPRPNRKARLPVLVWMHGGANWAGSPEPVIEAGLADRGMVVVTVNYRLGVFGFLSHPQLTRESGHAASGNYALMDQVAALDWVKRNIAAFGGDPSAVTIAGHSAGAEDVGLLILSPRAKGLFIRAIQQSGTAGFGLPPRSLGDSERLGQQLGVLAGAAADDAQLAALRHLDARKLLEAQMRLPAPTVVDPEFQYLQPVIDGWMLPAAPADLFKAGKIARVPLMIGNSAQEMPLFGGEAAVRWRAAQIYGNHAEQALSLYGLEDGLQPADDPTLGSTAMQLATDDSFRCPAEFTATSTAAAGPHVFRYQMEHSAPGAARIDHGSELTFVFDNRPLNVGVDGVRPLLQSYWVNFILRGDPNGPGLAQWPQYGSKHAYIAFTPAGPETRTGLRAPFCSLLQRP